MIMTSDISIMIPCPYHRVTEVLSNMLGVLELSDISSEVELILARVSTFSYSRNI